MSRRGGGGGGGGGGGPIDDGTSLWGNKQPPAPTGPPGGLSKKLCKNLNEKCSKNEVK